MNIQLPAIETERLLLKEISPETFQQIMTTCSDNEIMSLLGLYTFEDLHLEKIKYKNGLGTYRMSYKRFVIVEKATGKVLGKGGFHNWYAMHSRAEIGYAMDSDEDKGKGYMTEAVKAWIKHGYEHMGLNRIEAYVGKNNVPSLKIIKGCGFTEEGVLREHYCKDGVAEDSVCFGLLKAEYLSSGLAQK